MPWEVTGPVKERTRFIEQAQLDFQDFAIIGDAATSARLIGEIELPGAVNFCFGGPNRKVLFITADTAIYAAHLDSKGP